MKIYATTKLVGGSGKVILQSWPSKKAFEKSERWCDSRFINVATTADLELYRYHRSSFIVYTDDQIESHKLLQAKYFELNPE